MQFCLNFSSQVLELPEIKTTVVLLLTISWSFEPKLSDVEKLLVFAKA